MSTTVIPPLILGVDGLKWFFSLSLERNDGCGHSAEDVEEYITLLAYLLQSYVVIHPPVHGYHNDHPLCDHDDIREFSQEDLSYLENLKYHVSSLSGRCGSFLKEGQFLSLRTNLLLHMMAVIVYRRNVGELT